MSPKLLSGRARVRAYYKNDQQKLGHHSESSRPTTHTKVNPSICSQIMSDLTLICPPQGKSLADDFAEHINNWVEKRMQQSMSDIEFKRQLSVDKMSKEQKDLLKDIAKIRNVKETGKGKKKPTMLLSGPTFLASEKARLQKLKENMNKDSYRSDGNSSDDGSSVYSLEDEEDEIPSPQSNSVSKYKSNISVLSSKAKSAKKSSYEDRLREARIDNLQRRYSAQVRTEPIVNVNRRLKYDKK